MAHKTSRSDREYMNITFTNYAEKKAKQILNLLQGYTKGIRLTAILILLLMGVSNVWAASTVTGGHIYFDELNSGYTGAGDMQFWVGHNSYSCSYSMSKIDNTKLWYCTAPNWSDATYFAFTSGANWGGGNQKYYDRIGSNPWKSAIKENYALDSSSKLFVFRVASTANKAAVISDSPYGYQGTSYTSLNKTITIKAKVSTDGGSSYSEASTPAKLTGSSKVFTSTSSCAGISGASATLNAGSSSTTFKAGYTANTTLTAVAATGYTFAGWYSGSTKISENLSITVNPTGDVTYYAYYKKNQYTVTYGVHNSGNGSISAEAGSTSINSGAKVNHGSQVVFTASPSTGYRIQGWYSDANCTTSLSNGTNTTYTISSLTAAATVYVKYEEIPEEKFAVTIQPNNANYGTVSPSGQQQVGASGIEIEATPKYGYKFDQWTKTGSGVTIEDTSDPTTVIKATGTGTVTATFVEDLATTKWYISGNGNGSGNDLTPGSPFTGWATNGIQMFKKSGHSTEEIYYCTITANTIASSNDHFPFKVYNATTDKYWGKSGYWVTKENNSPTLSSNSGDNMKFRPYLTGTYEFKLDATNASSPVLTVTWPVYNQLRISAANPADATNTGEFDMTGSGTYTVTRSLKANTTYTFKIVYNSEWYGANSGNLTRASATKTLSTSGGDLTIKTDVAGNYTFTFKGSDKKLTVTYPPAYTVTYGVGTNKGTDEVTTEPSVTSGSLVIPSSSITFSKGETKEGYTWKNWNSKADGSGTNLGTGDTYVSSNRAADIAVYACYDLITYTITYNTNGGDGAMNPTSYNVTTATFSLPSPTKLGYTFDGWYTTSDFSDSKVTQLAKGSTGDKTFYAKWDPAKYTITYKDQGGEEFSGTHENEYPTTHTYNTPTTLKGATRVGYDFGGWFATIDCSSEPVITLGSTEYTTDITLYAKWLPKTYTINLDPQEGSGGTPSVSVTSGGPLSTIDVPSREAYNFGGYYDQEGGQGTQYYQPDGTSAKNWDKGTDATLYAHWIPTEYVITYELNGGTNHASNPATYNITDEVILQTPTYKGYTFLGWYESVDFAGEVISSIPKGSTGSKTFYAKWEIGTYTITLDLQSGTGGTETVSAIYGSAMPTITVPTREGYLFDGYYDQTGGKGTKYYNADGTNVKNWDKENATLYAKWISHSDCIFFKNNLKWSNVYIYTFTDNAWWNEGEKPGVHPKTNKKEHGQMTKVGQSDIYYYVLTEGNNFSYIAFSSANMSNYDAFYTNAGIYRGDHDVDMTLFIPDAKQRAETRNETKYYNKGVWMKYNSAQSGYKLNIVRGTQVEFTTDKVGGYVFTATMELSDKQKMDITNLQHERKYANDGTMTQKNCTNWQMSEWTWADESKWYVQTTSAGDYVFTLDLSDGQVRVSVQYPLAVGDYRLAYQENDGEKNTKFHPAQYIRKVTQDTKLDTISFFVNKAGQSPSIVLQKCDAVSNTGVGSWSTIETTSIDLSKIEQSGVYNVALQQTNEGSHQAKILCNNETYPQAYTGNYYIRTDAANGGWKNYKKETNQMEYTNLNADYDHYYCKWFNSPTGNVRFVVANDYSECVSDTMTRDDFLEGEYLLGESANVRFAWSSKTNTTSRAYLAGSGSNDEYLTISGTNIYTNAVTPVQIKDKREFVDQNNWVYALDIKAKNGAVIDVKAVYKGKESTFIDDKNIMSIQDDKYYTLRVIYNFKTNNMVSSWLLQDVQQDMALSADIMMIRNGQNAPNQLTLNGHSISGHPKTVYGVMQFDKSDITDNNKSKWEKGLYWISFPFDVKLVDVFGLGEYGTAWIIQYYDGAERAQKGWFQETATFWKYVMPEERKNFVLRKNIGYGLALDIEAIDWPNDIEQQNLYFPSAEKISTIGSELTSTTVDVPEHTCTIERDDRKTQDSHWNVIGVPSYADAEDVVSPDGLKFLYEWNATNNKLSVSNATTHTFKAMHSYMVQFAGTIDWKHKKIAPAALAAKAPAKESTLLQLTLTEGDKQLDQTYVELTDEATAAFDMNMDLTKFFNTGHANIYSCIQTVPVAANMLPVQSVQVPLGIQVVKEGSYTIALPASVDAALVTLIDNQTQTHTCLNTSDYTVTLPAGTYENRFFLAVEPQRVVTSDPANKQDTAPTVKFIKDGQLYILHQGVIYDAQGRR